MRTLAAVLSAVLLISVAAYVWAGYTVEQIKAKLKQKVEERWDCTGLKIDLELYPDPAKLDQGWFKSVTISATSATRRDVRLAPVVTKVWDVRLDLNKLFRQDEVVCLQYGRRYYYTKLSETDLNRALRLKHDMPIEDVRATLANGLITFTGNYQLGWGHKLLLAGRLVPKNRYEIHFVPTKASVNGIPIPAGPLRTLLNKLNPLLDMKDVPLQPEVRSIRIYSGVLEVQG
jgi:hypothetical protein